MRISRFVLALSRPRLDEPLYDQMAMSPFKPVARILSTSVLLHFAAYNRVLFHVFHRRGDWPRKPRHRARSMVRRR